MPWEATRTLAALELAGAGPVLQRDGTFRLGHPERADAELLADMQRHVGDITLLLRYRGSLEASRPADMPMGVGIGSAGLPYWLDAARPEPPPEQVARLAATLMAQARATAAVRITDEAKARGYFEGQAARQLLRTADPAQRAWPR